MGAKPLDKAALGVGLGGNVSCFALPEAKFFYFMFSEITVLSILAIIILKQVKDHVIKTICQSKSRGALPP